jgi:hypothetical protein
MNTRRGVPAAGLRAPVQKLFTYSLMELLVYCGMRPLCRAPLQLLNESFKADRAA